MMNDRHLHGGMGRFLTNAIREVGGAERRYLPETV